MSMLVVKQPSDSRVFSYWITDIGPFLWHGHDCHLINCSVCCQKYLFIFCWWYPRALSKQREWTTCGYGGHCLL